MEKVSSWLNTGIEPHLNQDCTLKESVFNDRLITLPYANFRGMSDDALKKASDSLAYKILSDKPDQDPSKINKCTSSLLGSMRDYARLNDPDVQSNYITIPWTSPGFVTLHSTHATPNKPYGPTPYSPASTPSQKNASPVAVILILILMIVFAVVITIGSGIQAVNRVDQGFFPGRNRNFTLFNFNDNNGVTRV